MIGDREARVFEVIKAKVCEVLGDIDPARITPERSLTELGANSIDRVEITMLAAEALGVSIPREELQGIKDLRGLTDVLNRHWNGS
jgi:polyketide biosynthesis acyl carrier protein